MQARIVKEFYGKDIKMLKQDEQLLFDAHDVAAALRFDNPRQEVVRAALTSRSNHVLAKWFNGEEVHLVELNYIVELVLRAEQDIARRFLLWLIKIGAAEVARNLNNNNSEKLGQYDKKLSSHYAVTQIAKKFNLTAIELNEILRKQGVQFKVNDQWVLYEEYQDKGYTTSKRIKSRRNGDSIYVYTTYWTDKGADFIVNLLFELGYGEQQNLDLQIRSDQ